jgi:hypothetical protein
MQCGVAVGAGFEVGDGAEMRWFGAVMWGWCGNEVVWWYGIGENRDGLVRWCGVAVIGAVEVVHCCGDGIFD